MELKGLIREKERVEGEIEGVRERIKGEKERLERENTEEIERLKGRVRRLRE